MNTVKKIVNSFNMRRKPFSVTFELTYRCNFNCVYCYQKPLKNSMNELKTSEIIRIIDILKDNGCIFIKFTGGEPFARNDLKEIYSHAYNSNLKVSLSSNASLIDDEYIEFFIEKSPEVINISLYGTSNEVYEKFTKVKNSWSTVRKNILSLIKKGINIRLKAVLNTINEEEMPLIMEFAKSIKTPLHIFTNIISFCDGNSEPKKFAVPASSRIKYLKSSTLTKNYNSGSYCNSGVSSIFIDCCGKMYLCPNVAEKSLSLVYYDFEMEWKRVLELRNKYILKKTPCSDCNLGIGTGICYPVYEREYNCLKTNLEEKCKICTEV